MNDDTVRRLEALVLEIDEEREQDESPAPTGTHTDGTRHEAA